MFGGVFAIVTIYLYGMNIKKREGQQDGTADVVAPVPKANTPQNFQLSGQAQSGVMNPIEQLAGANSQGGNVAK